MDQMMPIINEEIKLANKETGPIAIKVNDEDILNELKNIILSHWQITDGTEFFPAPQPVSLERRDLSKLIDFEYLVCAKSDGMRFLLVCYSGNSYMVDRAFKFYKVKLNFKNELYDGINKLGGIFDGELICNKLKKWQYVIHDCINMKGKDVSKNMFPVRYAEIIKLVADIWIANGSEFRLTSKQFFNFKQLGLLNKLIIEDKLDHNTDGLIFTPKNKKIGSHTQYDLFKWKPRELHTFDFKITKDSEGITAYVNKNGVHIKYANAPRNSVEEKIFLEGLEQNCKEFVNNCIVECDFDDQTDTYRPIKLRLDKTHPNSFYTVKKTLGNIKENITVEELIDLVSHSNT
jgi:mRNA guanylyltransferase